MTAAPASWHSGALPCQGRSLAGESKTFVARHSITPKTSAVFTPSPHAAVTIFGVSDRSGTMWIYPPGRTTVKPAVLLEGSSAVAFASILTLSERSGTDVFECDDPRTPILTTSLFQRSAMLRYRQPGRSQMARDGGET